MSIQGQIPRSPATRVTVNGSKIKFIRESKGLTQLYVATFLGITTDTVSRWENGKYPTVKWENVERLAKALDVKVEEFLDPEPESPSEEFSPAEPVKNDPPNPTGIGNRWYLMVFSVAIVLLAGVVFFSNTRREIAQLTATRFLPRHIAPGQPYPVVVRVESSGPQPFTFILEEKLPENFSVVRGLPDVASLDLEGNTVKWIGNSKQSPFFLAYLVQTPSSLQTAGKITFTGRIKADNAPRFEQSLLGDSELTISNYHWVDGNSDAVIDDEEILTVFSSVDILKGLGVDMDQIRQIWSAGGYRWDQENKQYRIIQKKAGG